MLHITNGDFAVAVLSQAVQGDFLPWRDVLHEGPVRAGLTLEELSHERAAFIADCGWSSLDEVNKGFRERDEALKGAPNHGEVVLWFEHDLYDQLQLIQLLDWFADHRHGSLSLVCEAEYLGQMKPARAAELFARRTTINNLQLAEAQRAWAAFRASDPRALGDVKPTALRFLGAALRRHLEEFPWLADGLSRTERAVLQALHEGPLRFGEIFVKTRDEPAFLGDSVLAWHLERMSREGLVVVQNNTWAAVAGATRARLPRWLGGVRVTEDSPWRWDPIGGSLVLR